ncbi:MAG: hypothetical protein M1547_14580, partial [Gammaproteobacteria bacterium]|nr:hypothetical protein [Gammaproteobacteria bacterium]
PGSRPGPGRAGRPKSRNPLQLFLAGTGFCIYSALAVFIKRPQAVCFFNSNRRFNSKIAQILRSAIFAHQFIGCALFCREQYAVAYGPTGEPVSCHNEKIQAIKEV